VTDDDLIQSIVDTFDASESRIKLFLDQLFAALDSSGDLAEHIHSMKSRLKHPDHLRGKLERKLARSSEEGVPFAITPGNLLTTVTDLAGIRILHLYTRQIRDIDRILRELFEENSYALIEGPFARTWDDESRAFFAECGIETQLSPNLYTSVHYVVGSASRTAMTCEVQVRTLMEEAWGEVDHQLNYPTPTEVFSSREQLKVLARVVSGATRLVDSIYLTHRAATSPPEVGE
jgi:ppGpp synthetase/RelA/SpoT-type nucleotidyltranferase